MTAAYALFKNETLDKKDIQKIYKETNASKNKNAPWK